MVREATAGVVDPPGFLPKEFDAPDLTAAGRNKGADAKAFEARASAMASAQLAPMLQTAFMLYMFVPNAISLFSLLFMMSMGSAPFRSLLNMSTGACVVWVVPRW